MSRMKDHQLRALVKLADEGSIRAAARAMNLSQSALTKSLRELEDAVGLPLLRRSAHGSSFTPAGALLLSRARLALSILDKAHRDLQFLQEAVCVRVGVTAYAVGSVLSQVLAEFRYRRPNVRVSIVETVAGDTLQRVRDGELDFAIGGSASARVRVGLDMETMASLPLSVICRAEHPLRHCTRWVDLDKTGWLLNTRPETAGARFIRWAQENAVFPEVIVEVASPYLVLELLPSSDLVSVIPTQMLASHLNLGALAVIQVVPPLPPIDIAVFKASGIPLSAAASELAAIFSKYLVPTGGPPRPAPAST